MNHSRSKEAREWKPRNEQATKQTREDKPETDISFYAGKLNDCRLPRVKLDFQNTKTNSNYRTTALVDCGSTSSLISHTLYATIYDGGAATPVTYKKARIEHVGNGYIDVIGLSDVTFLFKSKACVK